MTTEGPHPLLCNGWAQHPSAGLIGKRSRVLTWQHQAWRRRKSTPAPLPKPQGCVTLNFKGAITTPSIRRARHPPAELSRRVGHRRSNRLLFWRYLIDRIDSEKMYSHSWDYLQQIVVDIIDVHLYYCPSYNLEDSMLVKLRSLASVFWISFLLLSSPSIRAQESTPKADDHQNPTADFISIACDPGAPQELRSFKSRQIIRRASYLRDTIARLRADAAPPNDTSQKKK
jgi:hypothetical protein